MNILILNAGSSSLKFSVFNSENEEKILNGDIARIGLKDSKISCEYNGEEKQEIKNISSHSEALDAILALLQEYKIENIEAIGHRVVHGGVYFSAPIVIDDEVEEKIEKCCELAPLHNPINLICIRGAKNIFPESVHIALFDTAFHQTIPEINYLYAIPKKYYDEYKIRKYGFHGISHHYVSKRMREISDRNPQKIITCHIGNGASISAIENGKCVNTSMGFTPVDGLVMGTRAGDIDPGVVLFLQEKENLSPKETSDLINKHSGVLGLTGTVADLKDVEDGIKHDHPEYKLALDIYISRIVRFIGAYIADIWGVDSIVFTAWVLENSISIREKIAEKLAFCGVTFAPEKNDFRRKERCISTDNSKVELYVIPTREEYMMMQGVKKALPERKSFEL